MRIATNIYKQLTPDNLVKIKSVSDVISKTEVVDYATNTIAAVDPLFAIIDLDIRNSSKNSAWTQLTPLISLLSEIGKEKQPASNIQFWIQDLKKKPPINISFSIPTEIDGVTKQLESLELVISKNKKKYDNAKMNSIVWLAYDPTKERWNETIL